VLILSLPERLRFAWRQFRRHRDRGVRRLCLCHPCGAIGLKTAVVERDKLGGICLKLGCIPTRAAALVGDLPSDAPSRANRLQRGTNLKFDIAKIVGRSRKVSATALQRVGF